jgi:hypothetical protein
MPTVWLPRGASSKAPAHHRGLRCRTATAMTAAGPLHHRLRCRPPRDSHSATSAPPPRHANVILWRSWMLAWATEPGAIGDRHAAADRSMPASALPCPVGRSVPGRGGPERRRRRDRTGPEPAGTQWVHAEPAGRGVQRAPAVTTGSKEAQVSQPLKPRPGNTPIGGLEFESPHPAAVSLRPLLEMVVTEDGRPLRPSQEPSPTGGAIAALTRPFHPRAV